MGLVASFRFLSLTGFPDDHYVHLAGAQQMLHGEWPSRDFADLGAPLTYAVSAVAQALFGQRQLTEAWLMATAFALGAVLTLRAGVMLTGSVALGVAAALIEVLIFPRTYSYPKIVLYAAAAVFLLWYARRPSPARILTLAAFVVFAFLVRHDHGLYIGSASLIAVSLAPLPSDRVKGWASVALFVAAGLALVLPYLIYLQLVDGIVVHVRRALEFAALEAPRQRLDLGENPFHAAWLRYMTWLVPAIALAVMAYEAVAKKAEASRILRQIAPLVTLALVANMGLIRDRLEVRLPDAIVAPALLLVWLVYQTWQRLPAPFSFSFAARTMSLAALLITIWCAALMGNAVEQLDRVGVFNGVGRLPIRFGERVAEMDRPWVGRQAPSEAARVMRPFFDYADRCIGPDARLLVPGFLPEVPVLARRMVAGGQVWFMAGALTTPADHALVMRRLASQRVAVAVVRRPTYDDLAREFPELDAYITSRFTPIASWSLGGDDSITLLANESLATRRDAETTWPCFR